MRAASWISSNNDTTFRLSSSIRSLHIPSGKWRQVPSLTRPSLETFRSEAFLLARPTQFKIDMVGPTLPAISRWFPQTLLSPRYPGLESDYFRPFASALVPLEFYTNEGELFKRDEYTLDTFIRFSVMKAMEGDEIGFRCYLAQASLSALPEALRKDLPTPSVVAEAGRGDIYDANIWMGVPPTNTPLHRDPNPNLFVQLAGSKVIRILPPEHGDSVFAQIQSQLGRDGSAAFRGDEMMRGEERRLLDEAIWKDDSAKFDEFGSADKGCEVTVQAGDAVFIPKGWWHSIRSVDEWFTASVNWWFR